jgi:hypothetical protein
MQVASCFLLPSLALNSRIRDPSTFCLPKALKYGARDIIQSLLHNLAKDIKHTDLAHACNPSLAFKRNKSDDEVVPPRFLRTSSTPYDYNYNSGDTRLIRLPLTHIYVPLLRLFDLLFTPRFHFTTCKIEDAQARAAIATL